MICLLKHIVDTKIDESDYDANIQTRDCNFKLVEV